jgi:glycine/D-amino acid oxidase-like deaminating enzyme
MDPMGMGQVDVAVIGAGGVGIAVAYYLMRLGYARILENAPYAEEGLLWRVMMKR